MSAVPLSELISASGSRAGTNADLPVYSVTKHVGFVPSLEFFKKQVFSREIANYKIVEPGEFAYATIHLDEGSIGIAPERSVISPMYTVFRPDTDRVDPRYLIRFLKSPRALAHYPQLGKGAVHRRKAISLAALGTLPIPLPPVPEQRRIAAILDQADALRAERRQVLVQLDALTKSIFYEMFGDPSLPRTRIGDVAEVKSGSTPSRDDAANYGGRIPWVKTGEVQGSVITKTSEHVTEHGVKSAHLRMFPAGSVIVAMYGQGKTRGQSAILGVPATTNQACAVIGPSKSFRPEFLQAHLKVDYDRLRGEAEGGNQPNLSVGRVAGFEVACPDLHLQDAFVSRIHKLRDHRGRIDVQLGRDDELFASLQARAFHGDL